MLALVTKMMSAALNIAPTLFVGPQAILKSKKNKTAFRTMLALATKIVNAVLTIARTLFVDHQVMLK